MTGLLAASCATQEAPDWETLKAEIRAEYPEVAQLSTQALADWLADPEKKPPLLLDIREGEEYEVSHLQNAVLAGTEEAAAEILAGWDKTQPVVVYCSVGYRSSKMAEKLKKRGFEHVFNLEGSIFQWANEGRPVYSQDRRTDRVHPYDLKWGRLLNRDLWSASIQ
jgi:rhodanese-related sulfurtransferase